MSKNKFKKPVVIIFFTIILAVLIFVGLSIFGKNQGGKLDGFAQCLKDKGTVFYGAFWCPHCQDQKAEFGSSAKSLPYIECSNPDNSQTQICIDNKIEGYPTWVFKDGSRVTGKQSFETLAQKTGCALPK